MTTFRITYTVAYETGRSQPRVHPYLIEAESATEAKSIVREWVCQISKERVNAGQVSLSAEAVS